MTDGEKLRANWRNQGRLLASVYRYNEAAQLMREHGFDVPNMKANDPMYRAQPFLAGGAAGGHLWEMDHVVPCIDGGAGCGLELLRTLCLPCHKSESARLAAFRARKRAEVAAAEEERIKPRLPYID